MDNEMKQELRDNLNLGDLVIAQYWESGLFREKKVMVEAYLYGTSDTYIFLLPPRHRIPMVVSYGSLIRLKNCKTNYDTGECLG